MAQNNNVNSNQNQNNNVVNNAPTNSQNVDNQNASRASDAKDLASGLGGIFSGGSSRRGGNNRFMESALPRNDGNNNASSNSEKGKNPFSSKGKPSARDNINNAKQRYNQAKQNANNPYKMKKGHENEKDIRLCQADGGFGTVFRPGGTPLCVSPSMRRMPDSVAVL